MRRAETGTVQVDLSVAGPLPRHLPLVRSCIREEVLRCLRLGWQLFCCRRGRPRHSSRSLVLHLTHGPAMHADHRLLLVRHLETPLRGDSAVARQRRLYLITLRAGSTAVRCRCLAYHFGFVCAASRGVTARETVGLVAVRPSGARKTVTAGQDLVGAEEDSVELFGEELDVDELVLYFLLLFHFLLHLEPGAFSKHVLRVRRALVRQSDLDFLLFGFVALVGQTHSQVTVSDLVAHFFVFRGGFEPGRALGVGNSLCVERI